MKNNNQKIVGKLARRSLQYAKMRNLFSVITIFLSVSLVSGIAFFYSCQQEKTNRILAGMQHVIYQNVTEEQMEKLREDERVEESLVLKQGKAMEIEDYLLRPAYMEQRPSGIGGVELAEGRYPESMEEAVVDMAYMEHLGLTARLGTALQVTWLDGSTEKYIITGFTQIHNPEKEYTIYLSESYADGGSQLRDAPYMGAVRIIGADQMGEQEFKDCIIALGADYQIERKNINENNMFVQNKLMEFQETGLIVMVGIAVLLVSVLVIYSIFYLSVIGRIRQFGQLRTIGATSRQLGNMVFREGFWLFLAGAPAGILAGGIFAWLLEPDGWDMGQISLRALLVLAADFVTVCLSVRKPARMAGNISPVEASRLSGYEECGQKESSRLHRRLTPFSLARMGSVRNRRKTFVTILSLGVGGILFLTGAALLNGTDREGFSRQGGFYFGEAVIYFSYNAQELDQNNLSGLQAKDYMNEKLIRKIKAIPGVKEVMERKQHKVSFVYNNDTDIEYVCPITREELVRLEAYIGEGETDYDSLVQERGILINKNHLAKEYYGWHFQVGDRLQLRWFDGKQEREEWFTIAGETDKRLQKDDDMYQYAMSGFFLMPEELLKDMVQPGFNLNRELVVITEEEGRDAALDAVCALVDEIPVLKAETLRDRLETDRYFFETLEQVVFGMSAFIIGFSLINLINTLISNILSRKTELAALQAIGMSNRQLAGMIQGEGLILAFWNLLITAVLGTGAGYLLIALLRDNGVHYMRWQFPGWYLLGYGVALAAAPVLISMGAIRMVCKKSLAERIKETEA